MPRANVPLATIPFAVRKLKRRLEEVEHPGQPEEGTDLHAWAAITASNVNATLDEVFGPGTADAGDFRIDRHWFTPSWGPTSWDEKLEVFLRGQRRAVATIRAAIDRLEEKLVDASEMLAGNVLQAYEGLALHPEIARAANTL